MLMNKENSFSLEFVTQAWMKLEVFMNLFLENFYEENIFNKMDFWIFVKSNFKI